MDLVPTLPWLGLTLYKEVAGVSGRDIVHPRTQVLGQVSSDSGDHDTKLTQASTFPVSYPRKLI